MEYEGIPYLVKNPSKNQPDNLYNPDEIYTPIGTATIEKGEITSIEFSATPAGQAAKDLHANREEEKETDEVEEADAEPEDEQDAEEETQDAEPEPKEEEEAEEEEETLPKSLPGLKDYIKEMHDRQPGNYSYSAIKTREDLIKKIIQCQMYCKKTKRYNGTDLESKTKKQLQDIWKNELPKNKDFNKNPTSRNNESSYVSKEELVSYIKNCKGNPVRKGGYYWGRTYY